MTTTTTTTTTTRALRIVTALVLPPFAVALAAGLGRLFWINVLLTIIGVWVVGVMHALLVLAIAQRLPFEEFERNPHDPPLFSSTDRFLRRRGHPQSHSRQTSSASQQSATPTLPEWHDPPATNGRKPS